jgi:hypothetical protein
MRVRHSTLSFAVAVTLGACATSGPDNLHGPSYESDGGTATDGGADAAGGTTPETGGPADGGVDVTTTDGTAPEGGDAASETGADTGTAGDTGSPGDTGATEAGPPCTSSMALLAANATSLAEAIYGGGQWSAASVVSGGASAAPALIGLGSGYLAAFVGTGTVKWTAYTGSWAAPASIGAALGQGVPALAAIGTTGHVVYWGSDSKFYHGTYSGSAWDAASDPVGGSGASQGFGPSAPAAAASGTTLVETQSGSNGVVYDDAWTGTWAASTALTGSSVVTTLSPAMATMNGGTADLMQVYVQSSDAGSYYLEYSTRTSGAWSAPANVYAQGSNVAYAGTTPALAGLPNGGAILAWMGGTPAYPYVSTYTPGGGWSAPVAVSSDTLVSPPAVATGVCGATAVMAYVKTGGAIEVVTTSGGVWETPQAIAGAGGMQWVAVATVP